MGFHYFTKGLNLPITGQPVQEIEDAVSPRHVAILAADSVGLRAQMHVSVGDDVRRGQLLFEDKKTPKVRYTATATGTITKINRGARRALHSVVIGLSREEREGKKPNEVTLRSFSGRHPTGLNSDDVRELLIESGLWVTLRSRPFGRVADPSIRPNSIFITAIDTQPLSPSLDLVMSDLAEPFTRGLSALCRLTDGPVFVCTAPESTLDFQTSDQVRHEQFSGPHPVGTVGLHIHTLDPVDRKKVVWHIGVQDVATIGKLFQTGSLYVNRVISLGGPSVRRPRLLRTRLGVSLDEILSDQLENVETRIISGSVLTGRATVGSDLGYLGRYHQQVSVLEEGREREFFGWLKPGLNKFSSISTFISTLLPGKQFRFTTTTNGSQRAIVPIGMFESVMPFDLMITTLLRSLVMGDVDRAEELGCLELDEEDLALCSFVCSGKNDYGPHLRYVLDAIEREG